MSIMGVASRDWQKYLSWVEVQLSRDSISAQEEGNSGQLDQHNRIREVIFHHEKPAWFFGPPMGYPTPPKDLEALSFRYLKIEPDIRPEKIVPLVLPCYAEEVVQVYKCFKTAFQVMEHKIQKREESSGTSFEDDEEFFSEDHEFSPEEALVNDTSRNYKDQAPHRSKRQVLKRDDIREHRSPSPECDPRMLAVLTDFSTLALNDPKKMPVVE